MAFWGPNMRVESLGNNWKELFLCGNRLSFDELIDLYPGKLKSSSWRFFTNPSEKYACQIGNLPQISWWKFKKDKLKPPLIDLLLCPIVLCKMAASRHSTTQDETSLGISRNVEITWFPYVRTQSKISTKKLPMFQTLGKSSLVISIPPNNKNPIQK